MRVGLVRRLPGPLRRPVLMGANWLRHALEQRAGYGDLDPVTLRQLARISARQGRPYDGRRVAVIGLFSNRSGLQRGADLMVADLRARGGEVLAVDVGPALNLPVNLRTAATQNAASLRHWCPTDVVVHLNPPLFARALALLPPAALSRATIVGYWVWELSRVPPAWRESARYLDEIWSPSPFAAGSIAAGLGETGATIRTVPHAVDRDPLPRTSLVAREAARAEAGLPRDRFVVGTSFSFDSNYARKNPCAAIDAFRMAFRASEPATLLVRCHDAPMYPRLFDHLVGYAGRDARIRILDASRVPLPVRQFYAMLDLYVSLHRGEGYGLTLAEAAQTGLPVLATGWGLAPDIAQRPQVRTVDYRMVVPLDPQRFYDGFADVLWAEPDVLHAADLLQAELARWLVGQESLMESSSRVA